MLQSVGTRLLRTSRIEKLRMPVWMLAVLLAVVRGRRLPRTRNRFV